MTPGTSVGYLRLDKSSTCDTNHPGEAFQLGKIRTLHEGRDMTLVGTGGVVEEAMAAARELQTQGTNCRVLSAHTIKPLDREAVLRAATETGGLITIEEHTVHGGLGGAISETLLDGGIMPRVFHRIGLKSGFSSVVGSQQYLRRHYGLDAQAIVAKVREMLGSTSKGPSRMTLRAA